MAAYKYTIGIKTSNRNIPIDLMQITNDDVKKIFDPSRHPLLNIDIFTSFFEFEEELQEFLSENKINTEGMNLVVLYKKSKDDLNWEYLSDIIYAPDTHYFDLDNAVRVPLTYLRDKDYLKVIYDYSKYNRRLNKEMDIIERYMTNRATTGMLVEAVANVNEYLVYNGDKSHSNVNIKYLHLLADTRRKIDNKRKSIINSESVHDYDSSVLRSQITREEYYSLVEEIDIYNTELEAYIKEKQARRRKIYDEYITYLQETDDQITFEEYKQMYQITNDNSDEEYFMDKNPLSYLKHN